MNTPVDEFEVIAKLLRPLTRGAPEALDLADDVALLSIPEDCDQVLTMDAVVEGVHFLPDDPLDLVARKLLRVNLSDLAAKGAVPFGYLLTTAWPHGAGWAEREALARGLAQDGAEFDLRLLGGDTVSTPGPLTLSVAMIGWADKGRMIRRQGAFDGAALMVSGTIGDGFLGLKAARSEIDDANGWLAARYRLPSPRLGLRAALQSHAPAAADVSDGLLADAGHIAQASGCAVEIDLENLPLSAPARAWLERQPDRLAALIDLAAGGDDYEIACAVAPQNVEAMARAAAKAGVPMTPVGRFTRGAGVRARYDGAAATLGALGWNHGRQG